MKTQAREAGKNDKEESNVKKILAILIAATLCVSALAGMALAESALADGTYTAAQQGFGGPVEVSVTIEGGAITDVQITGDMETEGVGAAALEPLAGQIAAAQSADIDGVSGASVTSGAVKAAIADIIAQASGAEIAELAIADGVYEAQAWSFSTNYPLNVTTTIEGGAITAIEVGDNGDTEIILNTAIENKAEHKHEDKHHHYLRREFSYSNYEQIGRAHV